MATDVRLDAEDGNTVVVEGRVLKATASDFVLDAPSRRGKDERGARGLRRALVHDQRDGLTINFNRDYPGGVTINDVVALNNRFGGIRLSDVVEISPFIPSHGAAAAGTPGPAPAQALVLLGDIRIQHSSGVKPAAAAKTSAGSEAAARPDVTVSLQELLSEMQAEITYLRDKIKQLERRAK
jgi:hypothetical protein